MKQLIGLMLFVGCIMSASGLETYLTMENDTFLKNADDDYTHGTSLEGVTDRGYHFMLSQTMYAPADLTRKDHIEGDRPYCGMLLGGIGYEFSRGRESPWTNYGEIDFGMIGPASGCKETQTWIHKWLNCKTPEGWDNQLHNEFVVNGQWWTKYNWYIWKWMAIVPRVGYGVGTIQDFGEIGADLKIGWNIKPTVKNDIMLSAERDYGSWRDKLTAYIYIGPDERFYVYNHILEGSMFGNKDDGLDVEKEPFVGEVKAGAVIRYSRFFFSYYAIFRQREFKGQDRNPNYGGISIGWTW